MKKQRRLLALCLTAAMAVSGMGMSETRVLADESGVAESASQKYVEEMGQGWNLGNTFDGFEADTTKADPGETAWGNPTVTKELIKSVKEKGYKTIRMPLTLHRRYKVNESAKDDEIKYVIDADWLKRYKEVVDWAVDEDMHVMVNIHHDSWISLKYWDGNKNSEQYRMFTDFWKQLAPYFKDESDLVCFETLNEPQFEDSNNSQKYLDELNDAAYDIIRASGSNNKTRMIVMPSVYTKTDDAETTALLKEIQSKNDDNIIATVHYYCEWVYSANLGKTSFDEPLWDEYTPRDAVDTMMNTVKTKFVDNGIGVIVGEYGLLGYDTSEDCLQEGEEIKYYEYMNYKADENDVCLVFWDNGSGIDRNTAGNPWKKPVVGSVLEASLKGERSSYATGLDTLYFSDNASDDVEIALTLNGNTFTGIEGLTEGKDYTYDDTKSTVTLKKDFVNAKLDAKSGYGQAADLTMHFSKGADWHEYIVKNATATIGKATGNKTDGVTVPVTFNGNRVRRVMTYQVSGKVGPNSSWWSYLKYDEHFIVGKDSIKFTKSLFDDSSVNDGPTKAVVEFYDGSKAEIWMNIDGANVTVDPSYAVGADDINVSDTVCIYTGETEIPAQYLNIPEGAKLYGTYTKDDSIVKLEGWPASMTFDTKAHDKFTQAGVRVDCYDTEKYITINLGIKDAPAVSDVNVKADESTAVAVSNIADDAVVKYSVEDDTVATVDDKGNVKGLKEGNTAITATVTQYGRTDSFKANVTVAKADVKSDDNDNKDNGNKDNNKDNGNNGNAVTGKNDNDTNGGKTDNAGNKNVNNTNSNNNTTSNIDKTAQAAKPATKQATAAKTATKTGDNNKTAAWFMIMMAGVGVAAFGKKRILSK
ncbi:cellulase family glycosylhydrolase [Agathobacter sp.]